MALALDHCHRKQVVHGALSPSAVLVSETPEGQLAVRLYNFQLGAGGNVSSTVHWSSLADDAWSAYQAPELRQDRSAQRRFESARDMRRSWEQAFEVRAKSSPPDAPDETEGAPAEDEWNPDALARLSRDAPVATLPLSSRALNALDRAGLTTAGELLGLPDNRLSAVRGVGRRVAQEIDRFRKAWQAAAHLDGAEVEAFFPGYEKRSARCAEPWKAPPSSASGTTR